MTLLLRFLFILAFCILLRTSVWNYLSASLVEQHLGSFVSEGLFLAFYYLSLGSLALAAFFPRPLILRIGAVGLFAICLACIRQMGLGSIFDYVWLFLLCGLGLCRENALPSPRLIASQKFLLGFVAMIGAVRIFTLAGGGAMLARLPGEIFGNSSLWGEQAAYLLGPLEIGALYFLFRFSAPKAGIYLFLVCVMKGAIFARTPETFLLALLFVFFLAPAICLRGEVEAQKSE